MKVLVISDGYPTNEKPGYAVVVKEQVEALRRDGVEVDLFLVHGVESRINYLWGIPRLWAWLLTHRYDLIHAHYVFEGIIARSQFLYPVILTHHGYEVFMTWERIPSRIISSLVDRVILVSPEQKERLRGDKAEVIPCGVDFELFKPMSLEEARSRLNLPLDKKLVLWAGQAFRKGKRFELIEAAVALAQEKDPLIELVPVTGQSHENVAIYMNACDVLLLLSDAEGSPMVVKEAMACNLPIISTRVGDVPSIIGGTHGCYLCQQDPADVAQKLLLALNEPRRTDGRTRIGHIELGYVTRRIIAVYQELLNDKWRSPLFRLSRRIMGMQNNGNEDVKKAGRKAS